MCICVCFLLVHGNCPIRLPFCRSNAAKYCQRNEDNDVAELKGRQEDILALSLL